jgi:hypothetical protein
MLLIPLIEMSYKTPSIIISEIVSNEQEHRIRLHKRNERDGMEEVDRQSRVCLAQEK